MTYGNHYCSFRRGTGFQQQLFAQMTGGPFTLCLKESEREPVTCSYISFSECMYTCRPDRGFFFRFLLYPIIHSLNKGFLWLYIHCLLPQQAKTHTRTSSQFRTCRNVCLVWQVGIPGGMAQVAVMSPECCASRTICPGSCPYFIYVMVHLVNTTLPASHLLITTC